MVETMRGGRHASRGFLFVTERAAGSAARDAGVVKVSVVRTKAALTAVPHGRHGGNGIDIAARFRLNRQYCYWRGRERRGPNPVRWKMVRMMMIKNKNRGPESRTELYKSQGMDSLAVNLAQGRRAWLGKQVAAPGLFCAPTSGMGWAVTRVSPSHGMGRALIAHHSGAAAEHPAARVWSLGDLAGGTLRAIHYLLSRAGHWPSGPRLRKRVDHCR